MVLVLDLGSFGFVVWLCLVLVVVILSVVYGLCGELVDVLCLLGEECVNELFRCFGKIL